MRDNGKLLRAVCVPDIIWRSTRSVVREFVAGYFEADGCVNVSGVCAVSKDEQFLRDIQRLLLAFGVVARLAARQGKCQTGAVGTYWTLYLGKIASGVFEREVGFLSGRKKNMLATLTGRKNNNSVKQMVWEDEVVSVRPCVVVPVDVQVDGGEFALAGFVSHNSELKFVESGAMGVPVVTSRVAPYTEFMVEGENGFFASVPGEFAEKVLLVMRDEALSRRVSRNAYDKVAEDYDVRKNALRFMEDLVAARASVSRRGTA
jgi:hypothetical protein